MNIWGRGVGAEIGVMGLEVLRLRLGSLHSPFY